MKKFGMYLSLAMISLSLPACSLANSKEAGTVDAAVVNKEVEKNKSYAKKPQP